MRSTSAAWLVIFLWAGLSAPLSVAQTHLAAQPSQSSSDAPHSGASISASTIELRATSTMNVASEMGGAFMTPSKCDVDGNLYIRKFAGDRPLLGPVVKIDPDGKRTALFDLSGFSQLSLDRADAFSPASDGGLYQIAQSGVVKPRIYVLHFSSDGSPSSATRLDADFEVYTFAAFAGGNFLLSGVKRDLQDKSDRGRPFTAVFSADGRELAQLSFQERPETGKTAGNLNAGGHQQGSPTDAAKPAPVLDLADAEVGSDGNLYVMRSSSPALVFIIAPSGKVMQKIKVAGPHSATPSAFHVSGNRLAISFSSEQSESQTMVVADAQTGRKIASYVDSSGLGSTFACYDANEGVFTFLKLGEGNRLEVIRAEAQ